MSCCLIEFIGWCTVAAVLAWMAVEILYQFVFSTSLFHLNTENKPVMITGCE
jgi:hypothetical protein